MIYIKIMFSTVIIFVTSIIISFGVYFLIFINNYSDLFFRFVWIPIIALPIVYLAVFGAVLLWFLVSGLFVNIKENKKKPSRFYQFWVTFVTQQLNFFAGVRFVKTGFDKLPKKGPCLFVYNHISNFDPMLVMGLFYKYRVTCITKEANKRIPIAGPTIHKAGYISINRENNVEGLKSILLAIDFIKHYDQSICVAPEGTRSKTGNLLPFHAGTFKLASKTGVPIVVLGFRHTSQIHKNFPLKTTKVNFDVLDVIHEDDYKYLNTNEISNRVWALYEEYYKTEVL